MTGLARGREQLDIHNSNNKRCFSVAGFGAGVGEEFQSANRQLGNATEPDPEDIESETSNITSLACQGTAVALRFGGGAGQT